MAAEAGCVGFLCTNASPAMAPWGGRRKAVGSNPWSIAAPAGQLPPMMLDIANSGVARGKIYLARNKGLAIPPGWALDADGAPTTDPAAAIAGIILPMAEHKGYAISVMMDMLSGVLTGSAFGTRVNGPYVPDRVSGAGHFMIALDITKFMPLAEFNARMEQLVAELKAVPLAQGFEEIFYPGELEARNEAKHLAEGLTLPEDTLAGLAAIAGELGLEPVGR
jgi:LDH2 family malate/lactate/ureidoglycolate dehydrogenase